MAKRKKQATIERTIHPLPMMRRHSGDEPRIAGRLAEVAASAVARYVDRIARGKDVVHDEIVAHGVRSHAHAWCFDLRGTWADLVAAGCAYSGWLPKDGEYWEVVGLELSGRRIEISRFTGSLEVSVTYTSRERDRLSEEIDRRRDA